jgi:hypothetical protein
VAQVSGLGQRALRVKTREQLSSASEISDEFILATSAQQLHRRTTAASSTAHASFYQPVISASSSASHVPIASSDVDMVGVTPARGRDITSVVSSQHYYNQQKSLQQQQLIGAVHHQGLSVQAAHDAVLAAAYSGAGPMSPLSPPVSPVSSSLEPVRVAPPPPPSTTDERAQQVFHTPSFHLFQNNKLCLIHKYLMSNKSSIKRQKSARITRVE